MTASLASRPVSPDAALDRAAEILAASRLPVIAGMGVDMAGARHALHLARRLGAAVDHLAAPALLRRVRVLQDKGLMFTTPHEAGNRADLLLAVGPAAGRAQAIGALPSGAGERRIIRLCPGAGESSPMDGTEATGGAPSELPGLLACLAAAVQGHPLPPRGYAGLTAAAIQELAERLMAARFGVASWSAEDIDELAIEALTALLDSLNGHTRFTSLPLPAGDNAEGVNQLCGWTVGWPIRLGFGRGTAEHDPWRFDAARLVMSGEADAVLWLSAFRPAPPPWPTAHIPVIALTAAAEGFSPPPDVLIETGVPGVDHDAEFYDPQADAIVVRKAAAPSNKMTAAGLLAGLQARLEAGA